MSASTSTCWGCREGAGNQMAHMGKGGCLYTPSLLDDELEGLGGLEGLEVKVEKKAKRTRIYYTGIGAKKQQFYGEKAFRKLIDCSPEL